MTALQQIAVVVPARNEQTLLPGCLEALAVAARKSPVLVRTIVVLDRCTDASADVCSRHRVEVLEVAFGNVGQARHAGITRAIQSGIPVSSLWIANTDADSQVTPDWVVEQVRQAEEGADVVLGIVDIGLDVQVPMSILKAHKAVYSGRILPQGHHGHVHGANLGIRASTYLESGGFPPLSNHEDRHLMLRVRALGSPLVVPTTNLRVKTSGRSEGRCHRGFAHSIASLAVGLRQNVIDAAQRPPASA